MVIEFIANGVYLFKMPKSSETCPDITVVPPIKDKLLRSNGNSMHQVPFGTLNVGPSIQGMHQGVMSGFKWVVTFIQ